MTQRAWAIVQYWVRWFYYRSPLGSLVRRLNLRSSSPVRDPQYWDKMLAGEYAPYLGGRTRDEFKNAAIAALIKYYQPDGRVVLDLGCAGGGLADALRATAVTKYHGVDISEYAVQEAIRRHNAEPGRLPDCKFYASDLATFSFPESTRVDVIVFSEVLYYLDVDQAVNEVLRYLSYSHDNVLVVVEMKDDPKSHAIFAGLHKTLQWEYGVLFQEKLNGSDYCIRIGQVQRAFLIGLLRAGRRAR